MSNKVCSFPGNSGLLSLVISDGHDKRNRFPLAGGRHSWGSSAFNPTIEQSLRVPGHPCRAEAAGTRWPLPAGKEWWTGSLHCVSTLPEHLPWQHLARTGKEPAGLKGGSEGKRSCQWHINWRFDNTLTDEHVKKKEEMGPRGTQFRHNHSSYTFVFLQSSETHSSLQKFLGKTSHITVLSTSTAHIYPTHLFCSFRQHSQSCTAAACPSTSTFSFPQ